MFRRRSGDIVLEGRHWHSWRTSEVDKPVNVLGGCVLAILVNDAGWRRPTSTLRLLDGWFGLLRDAVHAQKRCNDGLFD